MKRDPIPDITDTEIALMRETARERFLTEDETRAAQGNGAPGLT